MNKVGLYLLSYLILAVPNCSSGSTTALAKENVDAPMPIFPRENLPGEDGKAVEAKQKPSWGYVKPDDRPVPKTLVLNTSYFSTEVNPKRAFQEACEQQGAHFNQPAFYYRKACILIQLKSYSRAEQELKNLIQDIPNNSDYHLARAFCYYKMNNKTAAVDEINLARFHNPRLPELIVVGND